MGAVQRVESAHIRVNDVDDTIEFYTDILGLVEIEADDETTYFGCGLDDNYDIAVREGEPGVDKFTIRVTDGEFDEHVEQLEEHDVETREGTEPGHERGIYFDLPVCGVTIGFVVVADTRYHHSAETSSFLDSTAPTSPDRGTTAPLDLDHVAFNSTDIQTDIRFLEEVAGIRLTDAQRDDDGWRNAFIRYGVHHHDFSVFTSDAENKLNHIAWAASDLSHMKLVAEKLSQLDIPLDRPFTKHGPGGNVAMYFEEPSGALFEYCTDMATVAPDAPEGIYDRADRKGGHSIWGGH